MKNIEEKNMDIVFAARKRAAKLGLDFDHAADDLAKVLYCLEEVTRDKIATKKKALTVLATTKINDKQVLDYQGGNLTKTWYYNQMKKFPMIEDYLRLCQEDIDKIGEAATEKRLREQIAELEKETEGMKELMRKYVEVKTRNEYLEEWCKNLEGKMKARWGKGNSFED